VFTLIPEWKRENSTARDVNAQERKLMFGTSLRTSHFGSPLSHIYLKWLKLLKRSGEVLRYKRGYNRQMACGKAELGVSGDVSDGSQD